MSMIFADGETKIIKFDCPHFEFCCEAQGKGRAQGRPRKSLKGQDYRL